MSRRERMKAWRKSKRHFWTGEDTRVLEQNFRGRSAHMKAIFWESTKDCLPPLKGAPR